MHTRENIGNNGIRKQYYDLRISSSMVKDAEYSEMLEWQRTLNSKKKQNQKIIFNIYYPDGKYLYQLFKVELSSLKAY